MSSGTTTISPHAAEPGLGPTEIQLLAEAKHREGRGFGSRERFVELIAGSLFLAAAIALALAFPSEQGTDAVTALVLVLLYAVVVHIRFEIGSGYASPHMLVFVPMLFLLPPALVPLLVAAARIAAALPDVARGKRHPERVLLGLGDSWYSIGPALVLAVAGVDGVDASEWPVYAAALVALFALDFPAIALRERFALGIPARSQLPEVAVAYVIDMLLSPVGLVVAAAADDGEYATALLIAFPVLALLALFARERRAHVEDALALSDAYRGTTLLLADLVENDDHYTGQHSRSVVSLALKLAAEMDLDDRQRRNLEFGALLHDVGKVAVPNEIINKRAALTESERELMAAHTVHGEAMLRRVGGVLSSAGQVVRSSHEHWDGGGYPDGLSGTEIPLEARIVACCDAYHAMTTDRPYRNALPVESALAELRRHAGSQFDPHVAEALIRVVERMRDGRASGDLELALARLAGAPGER
jgi:HD-GYP domain-containing protein (c-di-GMP phosphodiesterase class II)